jgi:hypothetical protein
MVPLIAAFSTLDFFGQKGFIQSVTAIFWSNIVVSNFL